MGSFNSVTGKVVACMIVLEGLIAAKRYSPQGTCIVYYEQGKITLESDPIIGRTPICYLSTQDIREGMTSKRWWSIKRILQNRILESEAKK